MQTSRRNIHRINSTKNKADLGIMERLFSSKREGNDSSPISSPDRAWKAIQNKNLQKDIRDRRSKDIRIKTRAATQKNLIPKPKPAVVKEKKEFPNAKIFEHKLIQYSKLVGEGAFGKVRKCYMTKSCSKAE